MLGQVVQIASSMDSCVATSATEILAVGFNLGEILQSTNGGASYNRLYKAVEFRERFLSAVAVNGTLLAAGHTYDSDGQVQAELITAPDGAKTRHNWRNITGPWRDNGGYALNAATASASAVVIGDGTGNIYVSRDPEVRCCSCLPNNWAMRCPFRVVVPGYIEQSTRELEFVCAFERLTVVAL